MGEQPEDSTRPDAEPSAAKQALPAQDRPLASAEVIRGRIVDLLRKQGMSLKEYSFFVHGTSSRVVGPSSQLEHDGADFFTVVSVERLVIFGLRNLEKAGGGERVGVLLILDNQTIKTGDRLYTIDPTPFQLEVNQYKAQIAEEQALLQVSQEQLSSAKDSLETAVSARTYAAQQQARYADLAAKEYAPKERLDEANDQLRQTTAEVKVYEVAIDKAQTGINVHQAANWGPDGHTSLGQAWVVSTWIATGLGWALATLLVAGYTGLVRQD